MDLAPRLAGLRPRRVGYREPCAADRRRRKDREARLNWRTREVRTFRRYRRRRTGQTLRSWRGTRQPFRRCRPGIGVDLQTASLPRSRRVPRFLLRLPPVFQFGVPACIRRLRSFAWEPGKESRAVICAGALPDLIVIEQSVVCFPRSPAFVPFSSRHGESPFSYIMKDRLSLSGWSIHNSRSRQSCRPGSLNREANFSKVVSGKPCCFQPSIPPASGRTRATPRRNRRSAARALEASFGQEQ